MAAREDLKVVAVIQARTGSSRLPGKVLADLAGAPLLSRVIERAALASLVDEVVVATSSKAQDDRVEALATGMGIRVHRGSEDDVLRRVLDAARAAEADVVVRLTGDCPLLDPELIDRVISRLVSEGQPCDYASNVLRRTFPRGLDAEAFHLDVLIRTDRLATAPEAREHVTWFIHHERPDLFVLGSVENDSDYSDLDWSVDDEDDLNLVRALYERHALDVRHLPWQQLVDAGPVP